ncbi:MAG: AEC family transporter [Pseudohongiella sp.]|nr:AEC family transporter [Pseudohongiella sp.]MDP2126159.1 AEC family transporter [Pseudohongiella sp.]
MGLVEGIFPVLTLALAGYLASRSGYLQTPETMALSKFTFNLIIPCLLFVNMVHADIPDNFGVDFLLAFYLPVLCVYLIAVLLARFWLAADTNFQSVFAMATTYSNTTVVGIPLVLQTLGSEALLPLFLIIATQNLVLFSVGTVVAEREHFDVRAMLKSITRLIKQLLSSPLTASLLAGLAFNLLAIPLYQPLDTSMTLMSEAAIPCALFILGTTLHQYKVGHQIKPALIITGLKLLLLPLLMALSMLVAFDIDPLWAKTAILGAAMPVGISAYVFSIRYNTGQAAVAAASVISTLASLFPLTLVLLLVP